jgi:acetoin utilization deacetylase AcuC-like enzyme
MKVAHSPAHAAHDPRFFLLRGKVVASEERPERARVLLAAAARAGLEAVEAAPATPADALAIHGLDYLRFLDDAATGWAALDGAGPEVVANVHPQRWGGTYPASLVGRAGWHMADAACPIGPGTVAAAYAAVGVALAAADLVVAGAPAAYALCRPPGHHAYPDMAGGFCFLNNAALAALRLRRAHPRVAVLDLDVHHGNGTQACFWRRGDVLTVSVHADPAHYYPFFWGHAHERGEGDGRGCNLNLPLPLGCDDATWLAATGAGLAAVRAFAPGALVIALGLDAHAGDPLRGLRVTTEAFHEAGRRVAAAGLPTVLVQEGGYLHPALGAGLEAFLAGFRACATGG